MFYMIKPCMWNCCALNNYVFELSSCLHDFGIKYFLFRKLLVQSRIKIINMLLLLGNVKIML
jgi:hypothetical protein